MLRGYELTWNVQFGKEGLYLGLDFGRFRVVKVQICEALEQGLIVVAEGSEHWLKQVVFFDLLHLLFKMRLRIFLCNHFRLFVSDMHFWPELLF